jgi:secretion/DNA translocation related TadE-like protein
MRQQKGSVAVLLCAVVVLLTGSGLALARLGATAGSVAHAETAADAAALAAAGELAAGRDPGTAARIAREVAHANGARLVRCRCSGGSATVLVSVPSPRPSSKRAVRAAARAEVFPRCPG